MLIRTQISLSRDEYHRAKHEAKQLGISLAEFFRRALRAALPISSQRSWMRYCGFIESGDPNASQQLDDVIYGSKS